jgi:hypothetical protein
MIGRFALSLPFSHSPYRANSSMIEVFFGRTSMLRLLAFDTSNMQQRGTMCVNRSSEFKRTKARLSSMLRGRRRCYGSLPLAVKSRPGRLSRTSQVEARRREWRHSRSLPTPVKPGRICRNCRYPVHQSAPLISTALFSLRSISHQHHQSRHSHRYHHYEGSRTVRSL